MWCFFFFLAITWIYLVMCWINCVVACVGWNLFGKLTNPLPEKDPWGWVLVVVKVEFHIEVDSPLIPVVAKHEGQFVVRLCLILINFDEVVAMSDTTGCLGTVFFFFEIEWSEDITWQCSIRVWHSYYIGWQPPVSYSCDDRNWEW